jgi:hypothetical protein
MAQFARQRDRLEPAEAFFNPLTFLLANLVTSVAGGSGIDGASAGSIGVLRDVRCCVHPATLGYKFSGVVALVGSHRYLLRSRDLLDHQQRRIPLRCPVGLQQLGVCDQPVAVLDEQIPTVAQFRFSASAFASQFGIRIGGGFMRVIGPALP